MDAGKEAELTTNPEIGGVYKLLAGMVSLASVESLMQQKLAAEAPRLTEIGGYLLNLGGKRIRPLLALLVARLCGMSQPSQPLVEVAAGIELIHMATLLHDDIIDKSPLRRHQRSPFAAFGLEPTLLTGDFLLVRAFSLCARLDSFIIDRTEQACVELTEGEILETSLTSSEHDATTSLTIARKKTAALFRLGALCGAHLAGVEESVVRLLGQFGESLGIAFQVLDDVLDVTSSENLLGKPAGTDIRERKPSLVNVLWLGSGSTLAQRLKQLPAERRDEEEAFVAIALEELRSARGAGAEAVAAARGYAQKFAEESREALEASAEALQGRADTLALGALRKLIEYTLIRLR